MITGWQFCRREFLHDCKLFITFSFSSLVVEVNEKDLADQGININPSELDFLLPVINPTTRPMLSGSQAQTSRPLANSKIQELKTTDRTLNIIKNLLGISSSFQKNNQNFQATTIKPLEKDRLLESKVEAEHLRSNAAVKDNGASQAKVNQKQPMSKYIYIETTKPFKEHELPSKQEYHNIYDLDIPVTIKRVQKNKEILPKEKQEVLNNTLALYGLRLDPKGQNVILQDAKEHRDSTKSKNRTEMKEMKGHKGIHKKIVLGTKEKNPERHFTKNEDTIQSLWNILHNVLIKWQ